MDPIGAVTAVVTLVFGTLVTAGATITGNQEKLCEGMGGTFTPSHTENVCPDGSWRNLVEPPSEAG